jgi:hypothetical protein
MPRAFPTSATVPSAFGAGLSESRQELRPCTCSARAEPSKVGPSRFIVPLMERLRRIRLLRLARVLGTAPNYGQSARQNCVLARQSPFGIPSLSTLGFDLASLRCHSSRECGRRRGRPQGQLTTRGHLTKSRQAGCAGQIRIGSSGVAMATLAQQTVYRP